MPWCPKCKTEYVEGMTTCNDCGSQLVAALDETEDALKLEPILSGAKEQIDLISSFLRENEINGINVTYDAENDCYQLFVTKEERTKAAQAVMVYLKENTTEDEFKEQTQPIAVKQAAFQSASEKSGEMRTSAWILLIVGIVGFIVIVLLFLGIIPFSFSASGKIISCSVMSFLFIAFIVMGIVSFRRSKALTQEAKEEENKISKLKDWCDANLLCDQIDFAVKKDEKTLPEQLFFLRTEYMKEAILKEFPSLDELFVDDFIEKKYSDLFD